MKYQLPAMISGIGSEGDQGQSRVQVDEHHADARQLQRLQKNAARGVIDQGVQRFRVVGDLAHEHPHLVLVVEAQGEFVQLAHQLVAEVGRHARADAAGNAPLPNADQRCRQAHQQQARHDRRQEQRAIPLGEFLAISGLKTWSTR